jgi:hypothetical protein
MPGLREQNEIPILRVLPVRDFQVYLVPLNLAFDMWEEPSSPYWRTTNRTLHIHVERQPGNIDCVFSGLKELYVQLLIIRHFYYPY